MLADRFVSMESATKVFDDWTPLSMTSVWRRGCFAGPSIAWCSMAALPPRWASSPIRWRSRQEHQPGTRPSAQVGAWVPNPSLGQGYVGFLSSMITRSASHPQLECLGPRPFDPRSAASVSIIAHYYRLSLGGVTLFFSEAGVQDGGLGYSGTGRPPEQPPWLMFNGGGRLNTTASVNHPLTKAVGSVNVLTEVVNVAQPPRLIGIN
jgi:hypothetical protein